MKHFLMSLLAWVVAMVLIIGVILVGVAISMDDEPDVEKGSYLVVSLVGSLLEYDPPGDIMSQVMGSKGVTLQDVLSNLEKAQVDKRIKGVIIKVAASLEAGNGKIQEIRQAIRDVQASGKKVYAYLESMDKGSYLIAAACDEIVSPVTAYNNFIGFSGTTTHVRGSLDKLGINPNIHKIKDYKSAAELVLRKDMSDEAREMRQWIMDDIWQMFVEILEEDRGLTEEKIVAIMEKAFLSTDQAKALGMIDKIMYWDELEDQLKTGEEEFQSISLSSYSKIDPKDLGLKGKKKIAVVHAQGMIMGRKNSVNPLLGITMGYETIVSELKEAMEDEDVVAVVFRVDSGGGDAFGSDMMGHQVEMVAKKKPVIVSMVDVAASGGYHISYRASHIMADPMTITGSIGSISGKFNNKEMMEWLGVTRDHISKGPNALIYSSDRDFSEEEWKLFTDDHWSGFNHWLKDVAEHRDMSVEEAEKLAHGRIFTGRQAKANGLVDSLGGLKEAIAKAKELGKLEVDTKITIEHYPKKKGMMDLIAGGEANALTLARWATYRLFREEIKETYQTVNQSVWMEETLRIQ